MKTLAALILFLMASQCSVLANASEKGYYEAIVNLQSIDKFFTGEPIHLSQDEELKSKLRDKLRKIIENFESYQATNPSKPEDYRVLFFLGKSYSFGHDLDMPQTWTKSVQYLNMALTLKPDSEEALMIQAKNYMDASKSAEALELYEKALASNPIGRGRLYLALAKISLGKSDETKEDLKKHLEIYPDDEYAKKVLSAVEDGRISGQ